jgi:hypothetical protein
MELDNIKHLEWIYERLAIHHREGINVDYMLRFKKIIEECQYMSNLERLKEEIGKNMEWKDLEIGNIPSDFFVNDRYEIQNLIDNGSNMEWVRTLFEPQQRDIVVKCMVELKSKYRYRLKPLESIRIDADIQKDLCSVYGIRNEKEQLEYYLTRKVEIIEE